MPKNILKKRIFFKIDFVENILRQKPFYVKINGALVNTVTTHQILYFFQIIELSANLFTLILAFWLGLTNENALKDPDQIVRQYDNKWKSNGSKNIPCQTNRKSSYLHNILGAN